MMSPLSRVQRVTTVCSQANTARAKNELNLIETDTNRGQPALKTAIACLESRFGYARHKEHYGLLILLTVALAALLQNLSSGSLPTFDDTTYALISKTIVRTGGWFTMRWLGVPYFYSGKPPLGFWFNAVFYKFFGISEFTSRLSATIHGIVGLVVVYCIGSLYSRRVGLIASAFLLSFPDYFRLSQSAMLEIPLAVYISLSMLFYLFTFEKQSTHWYCLSGISIGLAIMTKGLTGLIPLLVIGVFHLVERQPRVLFTRAFALLLTSAATVALPWHLLQYALWGSAFLTKYLFATLSWVAFNTLVPAQRSSPGFYLQTLYANDRIHLIVFLASLPLLVMHALRKNRTSAFLLTFIMFVFILFTSFKTRMAWHIAPIFPGMAVSSALLLSKLQDVRKMRPIVSLMLAAVFIYSMATLWKSDHWYIRGNPDLKRIVLDFKAKSSGNDVLFSYGIAEAVNSGPFYGDRKVVILTNSKEDIRVQNTIGGDYLQAGLIHFVVDEDDLIRFVCSTRDRHVIFPTDVYKGLSKKQHPLEADIVAEKGSLVIGRLLCTK